MHPTSSTETQPTPAPYDDNDVHMEVPSEKATAKLYGD